MNETAAAAAAGVVQALVLWFASAVRGRATGRWMLWRPVVILMGFSGALAAGGAILQLLDARGATVLAWGVTLAIVGLSLLRGRRAGARVSRSPLEVIPRASWKDYGVEDEKS